MDLKGKKVTVVGLGNSGINAARLLTGAGAVTKVTDAGSSPNVISAAESLLDEGVLVEYGGHTKGFIEGSDLIVVSPGVEDSSPPIRWALENNIPIISEMELGYNFCKGRIIAITGTNGKSTVTSLTGEILKAGGYDTVVCGNIGNSLCGEIKKISKDTWVVLEVSSFQLERIEKFKPHIAVILNITDDHMDRYKRFEDYFNEKLKVFKNQDKDDILILNRDASNLPPLEKRTRSKVLYYSKYNATNGAYCKEGSVVCVKGGREIVIGREGDWNLKGLHNLENILASSLAGMLAGVDEKAIGKTIKAFKGLSHRFETVAVIDGVEYIDDSKGTTVDSTLRAIESCDRPVILIAGGKDKNSDYSVIKEPVRKAVKNMVLIGEASDNIAASMGGMVNTTRAKTMEDAVKISHNLAKSGMIVLLSPMCSSFDMFKDYKDRGDVFKNAVLKLKDLSDHIKI